MGQVLSEKVHSFSNSLLNILRLQCFKSGSIINKKIKKPTPKDPNSKTSKKLKERIQMKKMKKIKKKEKKIQKQIAMKDKRRMDIETK